jgi:hypothetical protein
VGTRARCGARRRPWQWHLCVRQARVGGSRPAFYRRARERGGGAGRSTMEGGTAGTRPRQGRVVTGTSWLSHRESSAAARARIGHGWIWGKGGRFGRGPIGAYQGVDLWCGSPAGITGQVAGGPCPSMGQNGEGRERRVTKERERVRARVQTNFSQKFARNL